MSKPPRQPPDQHWFNKRQIKLNQLEKKSEKQQDTAAVPVVAAVVALKSTDTQVRAKERVKEESVVK
jgi:hypothetical protein